MTPGELFAFSKIDLPHRETLTKDSAISAEVIEKRGYQSVHSKRKLQEMGFGLAQRLVPTLVIPIWNVRGELAMYHHRPDSPRMRNGKPAKYEIPAGAHMVIDVHPMIREQMRDPSIPLIITEGVKKADSAVSAGLCCAALIGVWNWRGTNEHGGKSTLPDLDEIAWKDGRSKPRQVYLCFDSDVMLKKEVHLALSRFAGVLDRRGASVAFIYLPPGADGSKVGLDDYLAGSHTPEQLLRLASPEMREAPTPKDGSNLPSVETNGRQMRDVVADALAALVSANDPPKLFVRGGQLSFIAHDERRHCSIGEHTLPTMRNDLALCADWHSTSEKRGRIDVFAPRDIAEAIINLPEWQEIPPLDGIVTAPVVAPDGTLLTTPGYHRQASLYYDAPDGDDLPDSTPTPEACAAARELLLDDFLHDFPFADEASRAHALALILLPFLRPLISGPTPLHQIDAPKAGTGKTLLALAISMVFSPTGVAITTCPTSEEEWSKTLTSIFLGGQSHILLDNVRSLNSAKAFGAMTAERWRDRLQGGNKIPDLPIRQVWIATANNISGNDELTRRSIWIRLDAGVEQPEERQEFRHSDLLEWVKENRPRLVSAALVLVRAWLDAGRPHYTEQTLGSFPSWARVMGGVLEVAGVTGFLGNRKDQRERSDMETDSWHNFVGAWHEAYGGRPASCEDLLPIAIHWFGERLGAADPKSTDRSQKIRLGKLLLASVDRVYVGFKIVKADKVSSGLSKGAAQYRLDTTGNVGNDGKVFHTPIRSIVTLDKDMSHNTPIEPPNNFPVIPHIPQFSEPCDSPTPISASESYVREAVLGLVIAASEPVLFTEIVKEMIRSGHPQEVAKKTINDLQNEGRIKHTGFGYVLSEVSPQ